VPSPLRNKRLVASHHIPTRDTDDKQHVPLLNLAIIGELERVRRPFGQVVVAPSVVEEFRLEEGWILTESPSNRPLIRTLRQDLDRGESKAIALATEQRRPQIARRTGRASSCPKHRAERNGRVGHSGALGILSRAGREGELTSLSSLLDRLEEEAGFWMSAALREQILGGSE
jgi:hypothetical protein